MASRYGVTPGRSVIPADLRVIGGDVIGSDAERDTKVSLTSSRAQVVVDNEVKIDAQPSSVTINTGSGPGVTVDSSGKTIMVAPFDTVTSSDSPRAVAATDAVLAVNTSGGSVTLNFPDPSTIPSGQMFVICDLGSAATNSITLQSSGHTIGGASSQTLNQNRQQVTVMSADTEWLLF